MELADNRHSPVYADITWEVGVAPNHPSLAAASDWSIEVNDLGKSMDTAIGTPGAVQPDRCAGHCAKCLFERVLKSNHTSVRL